MCVCVGGGYSTTQRDKWSARVCWPRIHWEYEVWRTRDTPTISYNIAFNRWFLGMPHPNVKNWKNLTHVHVENSCVTGVSLWDKRVHPKLTAFYVHTRRMHNTIYEGDWKKILYIIIRRTQPSKHSQKKCKTYINRTGVNNTRGSNHMCGLRTNLKGHVLYIMFIQHE